MSGWAFWLPVAVVGWIVAMLILLRFFAVSRRFDEPAEDDVAEAVSPTRAAEAPAVVAHELEAPVERRRILLVDDDPGLRLLLRTTLAADEFAVEEAVSAEEAAEVTRFWSPSVVILDVGLPGMDGLAFCRELKRNPRNGSPFVVLLTGIDTAVAEVAEAGPDAVLRKPFSPLELVAVLDRVSDPESPFVAEPAEPDAEQLLIYARDLGRLLEVERTQRRLLQHAYRQTAVALADALEAKDPATGRHALRVQRYAVELTPAVATSLLDDPSLEYGYLLHDVGKIGIPDTILLKNAPLTPAERRIMERHTILGAQILSGIALLNGAGLRVVRSHHERWDGTGYPDGLAGPSIPLGARIFALVDAVDAMTSDRPYRSALPWADAMEEIRRQSGRQFDPRVVQAFVARERRMRRISEELAEAAA